MPLDAVFLSGLTAELSRRLTGMKIEKVQQPERDAALLTLRGPGGGAKLLLCAGVGTARLNITSSSFENPAQPPMFCMLLRKHLLGARIVSLTQPDMERLVVIELDARDEMGVPVSKRLVVEMMGRASNLILVGGEGHIIDCMRRVDSDMSSKRQLMPGMLYRLPPPQERARFFSLSSAERRALLKKAPAEAEADKWLMDTFSGLSPLIARELAFRGFGDSSAALGAAPSERREAFAELLDALADKVERGELRPVMLFKDGEAWDFTFTDIRQYGDGVTGAEYPGFSELLDAYYSGRDKRESMRRRTQSLLKTVRTARDRAARRLSQRRAELEKAADRERLRRFGDLITANLYRMKKGERRLEAEDWYEEGSPAVVVPLDPMKSPSQNAAKYYKDYNRAKSAEKHLTELITLASTELDYLDSVVDIISRAESERDVVELRRELTESGYIKAQRDGKKERAQQRAPLRFRSSGGLDILVGRSNSENDALTFKTARRTDMWLHVRKIHGSHVILCCEGEAPDESSIAEAASLAAYYSQARDSGRVPVDMTQVRYVKKPSGALPGMVIYTEQKTVMACGDAELAARLLTKGG